MPIIRRLALVCALASACFVVESIAQAAETARIGILAFRGNQEAIARWQPLTIYLRKNIPNVEFDLIPVNLNSVPDAIRDRAIDFLITNPGNFVTLAATHGLSAIATIKPVSRSSLASATQAAGSYGAVIFVKQSRDDLTSLADLKGKTLSAVSPQAFGGFQMAWREMQRQGVDPFTDLQSVKFIGFPQDGIVEAVRDGRADAGTLRTGMLETLAAEGRVTLSDFRVLNRIDHPGFPFLASTELYPEWPFATLPDTDPGLGERVSRALFAMPPLVIATARGAAVQWTVPQSYQKVRLMLAELGVGKAASSPLLPDWTNATWIWFVVLVVGLGVANVLGFRMILNKRLYELEQRVVELPILPEPIPDLERYAEKFKNLTPREREILAFLCRGEPNKRIAHELEISEKTVEFHRKNLIDKTGVRSTGALVHAATKLGLDG